MTNPLRGVLINGVYYDYDPSSYRQVKDTRTTINQAFNKRTITGITATPYDFALTIGLYNTTKILHGSSTVGDTLWLGVSQQVYLDALLGNPGNTITFVSPSGSTHFVRPTGNLHYEIFNPSNPNAVGVEYRVNLTFAEL